MCFKFVGQILYSMGRKHHGSGHVKIGSKVYSIVIVKGCT